MQHETVIDAVYRMCPFCGYPAPMQQKAAFAWRHVNWGHLMAPNIRLFWEILPHRIMNEDGVWCSGQGARIRSEPFLKTKK